MASSGFYEGKHSSWLTIRTEWSSTQNQLTNLSTIVCNHYLINTGALSIGEKTLSCTVGEDTKSITCPSIRTKDTHFLGSTTHTVKHDDDGTKTVDFSTTFNIKATLSGNYIEEITATSNDVELPDIPRNSTLTYVSGKVDEDYPTILVDDTTTQVNIKYKKEVTSYFNVLQVFAQIGTEEKLIKTITDTNGLTENYIFSFTESELNQILDFTKNSNLGITSDNLLVSIGFLSFRLSTYTDNTMETQIGSISTINKTARLTVSKSKPNLSATLEDINNKTTALTDENTLVRYMSTARVTPTYSANKGAYIKSVTVNGLDLGSYTYLDIVNSSATTYTIVVTDSRGLSTTLVFQSSDSNGDNYFNLINYIPLTIRADSLERNQPADSKIKLEYSGNYFNGKFNANNANTLEVSFRYKKTTESEENYSEWISLTPVIENNTYSQVFVSDAVLNYESAFDLEIKAVDKLDTRITTNLEVKKGIPIANWDSEKFNVNGSLKKNNQEVAIAENDQSLSTINTYSCDYINNLKKTIFEGELIGGESETLSDVKRFLEIYFTVNFSQYNLTGKYIIDTQIGKNNICYGSAVKYGFDATDGSEYYVSQCTFDRDTNTITHSVVGYFSISNQAFYGRQGNESYYVYRIDTYD